MWINGVPTINGVDSSPMALSYLPLKTLVQDLKEELPGICEEI